VMVGAGVLFGLAPALHLARPNLGEALRQGGAVLGGRWGGRLRAALVVGEVALALSLLVGAGLMLRTLLNLQAVPAGFDAHDALAVDLSFDADTHPAGDERARFLRDIAHRVELLPGVQAVGAATTLPTAGSTDSGVRDERQPDQDEFYISADYDFVSGGFFGAMGMTLVRGRGFEEHDDSRTAPRVSVINEALAARLFPGQDALGRRVRFQGQSWEVVGLMRNVRHRGLDSAPKEHIYVPQAFADLPCTLVVRTKVPPLALAERVRGAIASLDPGQPVSNVRTLDQVLGKSNAARRLMLNVLACFAAAAVLLAAVGLYGVMAYSIGRRTREIGVKMALGARAGSVMGEVMRQGIGLALVGLGVGLCGALLLTRVLGSLLFGVTPQDPLTFVGTAALLIVVAAMACWGPARRAMNVDPVEALRHE
jgi:predicted permease